MKFLEDYIIIFNSKKILGPEMDFSMILEVYLTPSLSWISWKIHEIHEFHENHDLRRVAVREHDRMTSTGPGSLTALGRKVTVVADTNNGPAEGIFEFSWIHEFHENSWNFMKIHEISWKSRSDTCDHRRCHQIPRNDSHGIRMTHITREKADRDRGYRLRDFAIGFCVSWNHKTS